MQAVSSGAVVMAATVVMSGEMVIMTLLSSATCKVPLDFCSRRRHRRDPGSSMECRPKRRISRMDVGFRGVLIRFVDCSKFRLIFQHMELGSRP